MSYHKPAGTIATTIKGKIEKFATFWTTGDEDFPCVHINDALELISEIERLRAQDRQE